MRCLHHCIATAVAVFAGQDRAGPAKQDIGGICHKGTSPTTDIMTVAGPAYLFTNKQDVKGNEDKLNVSNTGWGVVRVTGVQPLTGSHLNLGVHRLAIPCC